MVAILVAFTFLGLVLTDFAVQKWSAWRQKRSARASREFLSAPAALWHTPSGLNLSDGHLWFRPGPAGGVEIGVDRLIAHALGAVGHIALPQPGDHVTAGQPLFQMESAGRALTVPSAVTGIVESVNPRLRDQPALLNSDPYGNGWICRIAPAHRDSATPPTRVGKAAIAWLESEFSRLREFLSAQTPPELALGATSQDGGLPVPGCLAHLPKSAWSEFEVEFLKVK